MLMLRGKTLFFLCLRSVVVVCVFAVFLSAQSNSIPVIKDDKKALEAMIATLKTLGGGEKIDNINSLIIKGTGASTVTATNSALPDLKMGASTFEFETRIMLPNECVTIVRYPDRVVYTGISQDKMLTSYWGQFSGTVGQNLVMIYTERERIECSNILVGMLMKSGPRPLSLASTKKTDIFDIIVIGGGPAWSSNPRLRAGIISELEIDSKTGYPSVITYSELADVGGGSTVYKFSTDRFSVDGIMFPRAINTTRIIRIGGGKNTSEWRIDEVKINPNLSLKDFEVPKKR